MKTRIILPLLISLLAGCLTSAARQVPFSTWFKVVDTSDGLPDNSVNALAEDIWGSLWIGTWNGLCRFDGSGMVVYKHQPNDSTSLNNDMVRAVLPIAEGVFTATDNGLDFLDFRTGKFARCRIGGTEGAPTFQGRVSRLMANGRHIFAITSAGDLYRLEKRVASGETPLFVRISTPPGRRYADMCRFNGGRLMMLSNDGVGVCSESGDVEISMTRMNLKFDQNLNIYCDTLRGDVYIGSGLGRRSLRLTVAERNGKLNLNEEGFVPSDLMVATTDADGNMVFGTDGHGLQVVKADGTTECYTPDVSSIPGDVIYSLFRDSKGNLWCGSYRRGLFLLSPELNQCRIYNQESGILSHNIVTSSVALGGKFYIALDGGGIDVFDPATSMTANINSRNSGMPGDNVTSIVTDGHRLWASVYSHGLVEYDPATGGFTHLPLSENSEPGNHIWSLAVADDEKIIVGGRRLSCYDRRTGSFSELLPGEDINVTSMMNDGRRIWVGSRNGGIVAIDRATAKVVRRIVEREKSWGNLPSSGVDCVFHDAEGLLWVTMGKSGLYSIPTGENVTVGRCYSQADGLNDTRVKCITEDSDGNLWVGTVSGLYRYMRLQDRFVKVQNSRLPHEYTANSASFDGDHILMGSTAGLVSIPYTIWTSQATPLPTLFSAIDVPGPHGTYIPLYGSGAGRVRLDPDQNFFNVTFTVPDMTHPDQIQMQCRLEGFEDDWRDITGTRTVSYTNVPPGNYVMSVRHSEADGQWSEPVELAIEILYPWYLRWWALLIWGVIISGIGVTAFMLWRHYTTQRAEALEAEREKEAERRITEAKIEFFTGISHELRTPCFLISAQIEEIINNRNTTVRVGQLKDIYRNSLKLDKLVGNLMAFRKMESGTLELNVHNVDVCRLLATLTKDYTHLCRQKGIEFVFEKPAKPAIVRGDPDKIEIIVTNLVTNAYKFTPKNGRVELKVGGVNQSVTIEVRDTGIGIMKQHLTTLFDPFVRSDGGSVGQSGDGIGLSFVKKLVELHEGTIMVESEVNSGSVFTVTLPAAAVEDADPDDAVDEEMDDTEDIPVEDTSADAEPVSSVSVAPAIDPPGLLAAERIFLQKCRDCIEESLTNKDFEVKMIADKMSMSYSSLFKRIKTLTGLSVLEFVHDVRVRKAAALFKEGNNSVQNVSDAVGFRDVKTFRVAFKKRIGIPPSQYLLNMSREDKDVRLKI